MIRDRTEARTERYRKKKRPSDRQNILLFFYRKQFIQLKPIRAMTSELSDLIWGRLGLAAVRAVPLEEPRAPSAEAAVTELRPRGAVWTRELRLRPLPGQQVFTIDAMRLLVDRLQDLLAIRLPFLAKVSFQILLTRPAVNDEDEDRVELTHYFLRLAPWIVRPASPSARAGTMMAAIRTKFEVALERSRFPESDWTVVGITAAYLLTAPSQQLADMPAPPPPNEAGGCWKELPETLAKKKAIWNPQNEDHRCFMWCVLAHCLGVEGLTWQERKKTVSCSGPFFYPELAGRRGRRPAGWQPALADAGVDFSGLPTDRPVNFDDIEAFELRNAGRVEVFVFVWQQTLWTDGLEYYHVLQQRAPSGTGVVQHTVLLLLHSGHYSLIHNFQALAGRQGLTLQHRRLQGVQVPEVHGPLRHEGLVAAAPRHPVLSRDGRAHSESAAARAREEPAALQGQGLRRARAPDVLRGPRGLQHARPDGPRSAAAAGAPDRRGFFLLRRRRALRLRAARGAEAEAHAPRAGQRQVPRCPRHAGRPSQAGRPPGDAELGPSA